MMTLLCGTLAGLLAICEGETTAHRWILLKRSVMQIVYVFIVVSVNKLLDKRSSRWFKAQLRVCDEHWPKLVFDSEVPVKFHGDPTIVNPYLAAWRSGGMVFLLSFKA